jgi:hypothetical protein
MTILTLLAQVPGADEFSKNVGLVVIKILAVAGGALLGGLGCGFGGQALARLLYAGKLPPPVVQILRVAGGIVAALAVAVLVFSGTGGQGVPGPGGPGGPGGGGPDTGVTTSPTTPTTTPATNQGSPGGTTDPKKPGEVLQVEVLLLSGGGGTADPIYRIKGEEKRYTIKELGDEIDRRKKANKDLEKLEILLYLNSPDENKQQVKELDRLARLKGLTPSTTKVRGNAP